MKKKVTLVLDDRVYKRFQEYCEKYGLMLSRQVEICIDNKMKEAGK